MKNKLQSKLLTAYSRAGSFTSLAEEIKVPRSTVRRFILMGSAHPDTLEKILKYFTKKEQRHARKK